MKWSVLFFDLDDTLYSNSNGLWEAIRGRMTDYLRDPLGFPPGEIPELRRSYFETYGTTLRGLQINHSVDADEYLAYVHDLPLEEYISPDPQLHELLASLPQRKWIFTNADSNHAMRVLGILGLEDCFDGIIDVRALDYLCKPEVQAYQRALALLMKQILQIASYSMIPCATWHRRRRLVSPPCWLVLLKPNQERIIRSRN